MSEQFKKAIKKIEEKPVEQIMIVYSGELKRLRQLLGSGEINENEFSLECLKAMEYLLNMPSVKKDPNIIYALKTDEEEQLANATDIISKDNPSNNYVV